MKDSKQDKKKSRYERYNQAHPPITFRVPRPTHDMLKKIAEKRQQSLGRYCAAVLLSNQCGNCHRLFGRKPPYEQNAELQNLLSATLEENKALNDAITQWQQHTEKLKQDMIPQAKYTILKREMKINKTLALEFGEYATELERKAYQLEEQNTDLQNKLNHLQTQYATLQRELRELQAHNLAVENLEGEIIAKS